MLGFRFDWGKFVVRYLRALKSRMSHSGNWFGVVIHRNKLTLRLCPTYIFHYKIFNGSVVRNDSVLL